jgi:hypothetical protein
MLSLNTRCPLILAVVLKAGTVYHLYQKGGENEANTAAHEPYGYQTSRHGCSGHGKDY